MKLLKLINNLSVDVVLGAICGQYFFARLLDIDLNFSVYLLLGLTVWVIYTSDHLWDARFILKKAESERHLFHQKYFKNLTIVLGVVLFLIAGLFAKIVTLQEVLVPGLLFSILIGVSFVFLRYRNARKHGLKEVSTAILYVAGIAFAPLIYADELFNPLRFGLFRFGYFMIALVNLLMLSHFDKKEDEAHGFGSVLILMTEDQLLSLIKIIFGVLFSLLFLSLFFLTSFYHVHTCVLLGIGGIHYWVLKSNDLKEKRLILEWSFVLPIVLWVF